MADELTIPQKPSLEEFPIPKLVTDEFTPLGSSFPPARGDGYDAARLLKYAYTEIDRWHRSFCTVGDCLDSIWQHESFEKHFNYMLQALYMVSSDYNKTVPVEQALSLVEIEKALKTSFGFLRKWTGSIIDSAKTMDMLVQDQKASVLCLYHPVKEVSLLLDLETWPKYYLGNILNNVGYLYVKILDINQWIYADCRNAPK